MLETLLSVAALSVFKFLGLPIPVAFIGAIMTIYFLADINMISIFTWGYFEMVEYPLIAVPLFIYVGKIVDGSGIARYIFNLLDQTLGGFKGIYGTITAFGCALVGAITGSGFTGIAATGPIVIPEMEKRGYPRGYATALATVSSVLGLLIPPSIIMIIYGWVTRTSILAVFAATAIPGLVLATWLSIINYFYATKIFNIKVPPKRRIKERKEQVIKSFLSSLPALSLPIIILGGIYGGIFTPNEAAAVAVVVGCFIGLVVYKKWNLRDFYNSTVRTTAEIGSIIIMLFFALILGQIYVQIRAPREFINFLMGITENKILLLLLINVILELIGMIVDDITGMVIAGPLLLPLAVGLGIHPVHFGAIMGVNLAMGGITPPYATILFLGMSVGKVKFMEMLGSTMVFFFVAYLPVLMLTTFWEPLSMWLPRLLDLV